MKNMRSYFFLILLLVSSLESIGQDIPKNGVDIVNNKHLKYTKTNAKYGEVSVVQNPNTKSTKLKVETKVRPKFIYNASTLIPLQKQKLKKGQVILLSFEGITLKSGLETGEARFLWVLHQNKSYKGNLEATISLSREWKTYYIPFEITQDVSKQDLSLALQFGFQPQVALFDNIKFIVFDKGTPLASLPKTKIKYVGMEEGAVWRKKAHKRIEKNRKTDFQVRFMKNGKPFQDIEVYVKLVDHEFLWGATVNAEDIVSDKNQLKYLTKSFNEVVFANDLKIKSWSRPKNRQRTRNAIEKIKEQNLGIKGHVLIWPGFQYQPQEVRNLEKYPEKLANKIHNHVVNITETTKGAISHWDVVNEAYTNKDFQQITGSEEILYDGFRVLKNRQPNVGRFTNEYGIISKGGIDFEKQQWYYNYIKRIDKNTKGLVDGIGIQCHIGSDLTPPKKVIEILNYYGTLNKKISISEFTMEIKDAEIREKYTSDFIIAAFSQPNVSEFLFWGFHASGNPKAIVYNQDWSLAPMGKAFHKLVHEKWQTSFSEKTDKEGGFKGSGFYGTYEYSYVEKNKIVTGKFKILKGASSDILINIQ